MRRLKSKKVLLSIAVTMILSLMIPILSTATEAIPAPWDPYESWDAKKGCEELYLLEGGEGGLVPSESGEMNGSLGEVESIQNIAPLSAGLVSLNITGSYHFNRANQILTLVNEERQRRGLVPLAMDRNLQDAAMVRAREINVYHSHTRPDGTHFSTAMPVQFRPFSGENIAWSQGLSPQRVFDLWMNSPTHRDNILNPNFRSIGVGHFQQWHWQEHWVQLFSPALPTNTQLRTGSVETTRDVSVTPSRVRLHRYGFGVDVPTIQVGAYYRGVVRNLNGINNRLGFATINSSSFLWSSSNTRIATVNQEGFVRGVAAGTTVITARLRADNNLVLSFTVRVQAPPPPPPLPPGGGGQEQATIPLWRMFNSSLNQHLWTTCQNEYRLLATRGWRQEGIAWHTPRTGRPVHRLFHPGIIRHHYTADQNEIRILRGQGWNDEGPLFFCASPHVRPGEGIRMTRLFHAGSLKHLHTADANEVRILTTRYGWRNEGESFVGLPVR